MASSRTAEFRWRRLIVSEVSIDSTTYITTVVVVREHGSLFMISGLLYHVRLRTYVC